jgi:hypothetical protein
MCISLGVSRALEEYRSGRSDMSMKNDLEPIPIGGILYE